MAGRPKSGKNQFTVRKEERTLYTPFAPGDVQRTEYVNTMIVRGAELKALNDKIDALKEEAKPIQKVYDTTETALLDGAPEQVAVKVKFYHGLSKVVVVREDRNSVVSMRDMTEEDAQIDEWDEEGED